MLEGYNGTVFAYGQTGCGKSFSMQGVKSPQEQRGIIPRSFEHIFEAIDASENMKYLVHASYLEIYNEDIRDLLGDDTRKRLELKEHPDKGVYVKGKWLSQNVYPGTILPANSFHWPLTNHHFYYGYRVESLGSMFSVLPCVCA